VKKTRQNKNLEPRFDSIETEKALGAPIRCYFAGGKRRAATGVTLGAVLAVAISGCAVGPNFKPAAVAGRDGYVPGKLASPNPGQGGPRSPASTLSPAPTSPRAGGRRSNPRRSRADKTVGQSQSEFAGAEAAIKIAQYNALAQRGLFFPQVTGNSTSQQFLIANP